jgi:hypothetical protein
MGTPVKAGELELVALERVVTGGAPEWPDPAATAALAFPAQAAV